MDQSIDPSIKKILNNGGFIAALAPVLASRLAADSKLYYAVAALAESATAYSKMTAALGLNHTPENDWGGCDQAKALLRWINARPGAATSTEEYDAFVLQVEKWNADIWSAISDLAAGKIPS